MCTRVIEQENATFTSYPTIEQTSVADGRETSALLGVASASAGVTRATSSSAEGVSLAAGRDPITTIVPAGTYQDMEMPCGLRTHPQMNVKVGVIKDLVGNRGRLQILDQDRISGNRILVLRPKRLTMPCHFDELPWPSKPDEIMHHR